jgi:hypothetical protein
MNRSSKSRRVIFLHSAQSVCTQQGLHCRKETHSLDHLTAMISYTVSTELKYYCQHSQAYLLIINTHYTDAFIRDPSVSMTMITVYTGTHASPGEVQEGSIFCVVSPCPKKALWGGRSIGTMEGGVI